MFSPNFAPRSLRTVIPLLWLLLSRSSHAHATLADQPTMRASTDQAPRRAQERSRRLRAASRRVRDAFQVLILMSHVCPMYEPCYLAWAQAPWRSLQLHGAACRSAILYTRTNRTVCQLAKLARWQQVTQHEISSRVKMRHAGVAQCDGRCIGISALGMCDRRSWQQGICGRGHHLLTRVSGDRGRY